MQSEQDSDTKEYLVFELIGQLRINREQHMKDYQKALCQYHYQCQERLFRIQNKIESNLIKVQDSIVTKQPEINLLDIIKDIDCYVEKPVEYLEIYDTMILRLSNEKRESLLLSLESKYLTLIDVKWDWEKCCSRCKNELKLLRV